MSTSPALLCEGNFSVDVERTGPSWRLSQPAQLPGPNGSTLTQCPQDSPRTQGLLSAVVMPNKASETRPGALNHSTRGMLGKGKAERQPLLIPSGFSCAPVREKEKHLLIARSNVE